MPSFDEFKTGDFRPLFPLETRASPAAALDPRRDDARATEFGWGVLIAKCDKSRDAKHFDRSTDRKADVTNAELAGPDVELRLNKTVVGRMLMNADATARASTQVADILIDVLRCVRVRARAPELDPESARPRSHAIVGTFLSLRPEPVFLLAVSAKHAVISCEGGDDGPESYKVTITDHPATA